MILYVCVCVFELGVEFHYHNLIVVTSKVSTWGTVFL